MSIYPGVRYLPILALSLLTTSCGGSSGGGGVGSVSLNWQSPTQNSDETALNDLNGYKIYYTRDGETSYVTVDDPGITEYVVEGLHLNAVYYFAVTAYNSENIESSFSNIVSKTVVK